MTNRTPTQTPTQTRQTVVGVFDNRDAAQRAIEQLKAAGFRPEDIGILMKNQQGAQQMAQNTGTGSAAGKDAGTGAVWGGVLGGIGGLIVGVAALAIPGVGPVIAAGPLAAGLGTVLGTTAVGAAVGAGAGAIVGALVGMGVPENEAQVYQQRFNKGRILVTVNAGPARYNEAQQILRNAGAEKIDFNNEAAGTARATTAPAATGQRTATTAQTATGPGQTLNVPVVEETLEANKGVREAGEVAVRKNVVEQQVNVPVEVSHEEVTVSRVEADRPLKAGEAALQEGEVLRVPVREETVDVEKQARVTGEVQIRKEQVSDQRNVQGTVRREEVDVEPTGNIKARPGAPQEGEAPYTPNAETNPDVNTAGQA